MSIASMRAGAHPLDGDRVVVPEPLVKAWLDDRGVPVPRVAGEADPGRPLVLKAHGPGIVHKSDVGAVALGLRAADLDDARAAMRARVEAAGATVAGFLVEEQVPAGVELVAGVVAHPVYGPLLAVGLGGLFAEVIDDVSIRPMPVEPAEVSAMLRSLRGHALLTGARGGEPVDEEAVVATVHAIAEAAASLGPELAELECNPVIAGPGGAVAADARLVLRTAEPSPANRPSTDFARLFEPRGVAVAGASTSRSVFGNWLLTALREYGCPHLAALHPTATEIEGVPAHPTVDDVPHDVDYVIAAVPAPGCPELVAACSRAEFVHVISGGFREAGNDDLEQELLAAARAAGVRVLGPNCMGVFSPKGRLTFQLDAPTRHGDVAVVSQSGGLAGDLVKLGDGVGLGLSKLVTVGNAVDVAPGELVDWLIEDLDTRVIGLYLEDPRDGAGLVAALRRAAGRVPVVALVGGTSRQGARAVASHTGALAADTRIWDGIGAATGATVVTTLEQLVGTLRYLQRFGDRPPVGTPTVLVGGVGGGATVLAADACDRAGLDIRRLHDDGQAVLRALGYGVGTSVVNPVEIPVGPKVPPGRLAGAVRAVLEVQPFTDVLVHLNVQSYYSFGDGGGELVPFVDSVGELSRQVPTALVLRNLACAPARDRELVERACVDHDVVWFATLDDAAVAIAAGQRASWSGAARD